MPTSPKNVWRRIARPISERWPDPVWSKVIATAILGMISLAYFGGAKLFHSLRTGSERPPDVQIAAPVEPPRDTRAAPSPSAISPPAAQAPVPSAVGRERVPQTHRFVNRGAFNPTAAAVLLWDRDTADVSRLTDTIAARLKGVGGLFTSAFVESGRFSRAMGGDVDALREAGVTERAASLIVLGTHTSVTTSHEPVSGVLTYKAVVSASIRVFKPGAGFQSELFVEEVTAPGMNARGAESAADRELIDRVLQRLEPDQ